MKILDVNDEIEFDEDSLDSFQMVLIKIIKKVIKSELKNFENEVLNAKIKLINDKIDSLHSSTTT